MGVRRFLAENVPPGFVRWLGRLQFQVPVLRPAIQYLGAGVRSGQTIMRRGIGRGLKFDPRGGNPGYAIGTSDMDEQKTLAAHLKDGQVFYDIGANVGFFTTLAGRLVGGRGKVYGFEPFPASAQTAQANADRNNFTHVKIFTTAVCDSEGEATFNANGPPANFRLVESTQPQATVEGHIAVRTVTIDGLIAHNEIAPPNVVMIDTEGAELAVIRGMAKTIKAFRPTIICEVHWMPASQFLDGLRAAVGDGVYRVSRLDNQAFSEGFERYHVLMLPLPPNST